MGNFHELSADDSDEQDEDVWAAVTKYLSKTKAKLPPLIWWKMHCPKLSCIEASMAKKYMNRPATSVPLERLFSLAGSIVSKKRACLNSGTADQLFFLNSHH